MPVGTFNDLVACYAIEHGAEEKKAIKMGGDFTEEELFPDLR